ncbi:alpha/beta fold hydrolase [Lichenicoccus sp.]|uniref:alpha/beta fold hydrolase n=1 Tax=Lichenicoccus sp. TaxID=2781899 RepID=UPI003D151152
MRIAVNGVQLYFDVEGAGLVAAGPAMRERPTLLLLHGGPGADHATYKPFMSPFVEHAQVIYLDHRGNGRSDESTPDDWTLSQWADDVAGFLDALDIRKPYVLGASFGGFVAQAFAAAYPERVSKLGLVCTAPRTDAELSAQMFAELGGAEIGEIARRHLSQTGGPETEAEFMRRCLPYYCLGEFDRIALGRSIDRPEVRRHFFRRGGEWHTMDFRSVLARVECPTLVLHGDRDPILPLPLARELHAAIRPGLSRLHIVENAGHICTVDKPNEWLAALETFLFKTE